MEQTTDSKNKDAHPPKKEQFNRSIGLISNFALGFTYLRRSPPFIPCLRWR